MATYYVRADGTAANKAAATSPDNASTSMPLETADDESYLAGDVIHFSSNGGVYRTGTFNVSSSGADGNPITVTFDAACVFSCQLSTSWTVYSGNVYQCTESTEIVDLHYDDTQGTKQGSIGACTSEGDWHWASSTLYMYAPGDPDTQYTSPGVETTPTGLGPAIHTSDKSYIELEGSGCEIKYRTAQGIKVTKLNGDVATDVVIDNFKIHDIMLGHGGQDDGLSTRGVSNLTLKRLEIYNVAYDGIDGLTSSASMNQSADNITIEECLVYDNEHVGISFQNQSGSIGMDNLIIRRCRTHGNSNEGIYIWSGAADDLTSVYVYSNVAYDNGRWGIMVNRGGDGNYVTPCYVTNNVCYKNGTDTTGGAILTYSTSGVIKNNICMENNVSNAYSCEISVYDGGGTANDVDYNCVYKPSKADLYAEDVTKYTHSEYVAFGQQTNGINADPQMTDPDNDDFTLQSGSPCIGQGANLGPPYDVALMSGSTWPDGVLTGDQDDY